MAQAIEMRFGALPVLDDVNFVVADGEAVGIVGPNGAGKTTLLNVLSGAMRPSAGRVTFRGEDVTPLDAAHRCRLGIGRSHQVPRPFSDMTVFENVLVGASAGAGRSRSAANQLALGVLEECALAELANRRAGSLGLLHRKRLELARALATDPAVILLDEIGGGLTDLEAAELVKTLLAIRERGVSIVWIEHVVHVLVQLVSRLVCMNAGRVIADGKPETVMQDAAVVDAYLGRRR
ncbi:MAG: ATP-binding cassette domain-containing protein [Candidatus Dormibacter sp.]